MLLRTVAFAAVLALAAVACSGQSLKAACTALCNQDPSVGSSKDLKLCKKRCKACFQSEDNVVKACEADCKERLNGPERKDCRADCQRERRCHNQFGQSTTTTTTTAAPPKNDLPLNELYLLKDHFRDPSGHGNNVANPEWGSAHTHLLRMAPANYADGQSEIPFYRTNPREVSNVVSSQEGQRRSTVFATDFLWAFGQFLDHDIDLTDPISPADPADVPIPTGDPFFDPAATGTQVMKFNRSDYVVRNGVREQMNSITAFIDGSVIYGSDQARMDELREGSSPFLKTSSNHNLPFNVNGFPNAMSTSPHFFLAGDVRANEQVVLTALHTVWVREHNRLARIMRDNMPEKGDSYIFNTARVLVSAQLQHITYNEFLPTLLGPDALGPYQGYNPSINPGINNEFSTAAFRVGHTLVATNLLRLGRNGLPNKSPLPLREAFFNPTYIRENGFEDLLRGMSKQLAGELDPFVVDDLRNFLFGKPGMGGFDLVCLNIQRGRDHGLPDYASARRALNLPEFKSWQQVTESSELRQRLSQAYPSMETVDLWVAGLAEDPVRNGMVGPTFFRIIRDQFRRIRDGDRFWYETLPRAVVDWVKSRTLKSVLVDNTGIDAGELPDHVMKATHCIDEL